MKHQAFGTKSITESVVAFMQFARGHGLNIGIGETQEALFCASQDLIQNRKAFTYALKAICCTSPEERKVFDQLFLLFWDSNPLDQQDQKNRTLLQGLVQKNTNASLVLLGHGSTDPRTTEGKSFSGASRTERLKKTDLAMLTQIEAELLEKISEKLFRQMAVRLHRRRKMDQGNGPVNLRRTIRGSIAFGGEPMELFHRTRSPRKRRLVVFLDVSGSMDKYSVFLLRFIYALRKHFRQMEAFVFSTSLIRISKGLQQRRVDWVLNHITERADNWSSGTRIGECFREFNVVYGKRIMNGAPTVLVMSDGLDTGDPPLLLAEMKQLKKRAKQIVWLNPLKGMKGYVPEAKGMKAALGVIDDFRSAHTLDSLLELENILADA